MAPGAAQRCRRARPGGQPDQRQPACRSASTELLLARDISQLNRLEQVRRDFVANVSHELRTPLTVIHGYLELLDPEDVPELAPVLDEMRRQSQAHGPDRRRPADPVATGNPAPVAGRTRADGGAAGHRAQGGRSAQPGPSPDQPGIHRRSRPARLAEGSAQRALQPGQQCRALYAGWRQHHDPLAARQPRRRGVLGAATPASAFRPSTWPGSPSASTAFRPAARATAAAPAWACRSSSMC